MEARTLVTTVILTYNRARLLPYSLRSALAQDFADYRVIVLDNASTDETPQVVSSFSDPRLTYVRNETNIGLWRNLNKAIDVNTSPYLSILHDDDAVLPGFISASVRALEDHPSAGFSFSLVRFIDGDGNPRELQDPKGTPGGFLKGHDFLKRVIDQMDCAIMPPAVLFRAEALARMKPMDSPHTGMTADLNLYIRMMSCFDVVFLKQELAQLRVHTGQETATQFASSYAIGWYGSLAERIDAATHLLRTPRAAEPTYRDWLAQRLFALHKHQSTAVHSFAPSGYHSWAVRREMVCRDLARVVPANVECIVVDNDELGIDAVHGCQPIPFLEKDGQPWGPPSDESTAIRELERLRARAGLIAFAWVAFWWFDRFPVFRDYLRSKFPCVLDNANLVVFDIR